MREAETAEAIAATPCHWRAKEELAVGIMNIMSTIKVVSRQGDVVVEGRGGVVGEAGKGIVGFGLWC